MATRLSAWFKNMFWPTFRVSAKIALYSADGQKVLMMKYRKGHYGLPGGHIEKGEAPETALRRELQEELGIEIGPVQRKDFFQREDSFILAFVSRSQSSDPELNPPNPAKETGVWLTRTELEAIERTLPAYKTFILENWPV